MANVTCAISGLRFEVPYLDSLNLNHTYGFIHPIFALSACDTRDALYTLYSRHCKGLLPKKDSYLLFLAILHSTEHIQWSCPASMNPTEPSSIRFIENNIAQLVRVIEKTECIRHPSFNQPSFRIHTDSCSLSLLPNWIRAWSDNIDDFYSVRSTIKEREDLQKIENKLTCLIKSGESPEKFSEIVANWAEAAADFPKHKAALWKKTIRSCFNIKKMFATPLPLLKEIKVYCEENIGVGSIHFHTLSHVLKEGIFRHTDYLGGSSLAIGYTLLPTLSTLVDTSIGEKYNVTNSATTNRINHMSNTPSFERAGDSNNTNNSSRSSEKGARDITAIQAVVSNAPKRLPKKEDYSSSLDFLRAKLAYRTATIALSQHKESQDTDS